MAYEVERVVIQPTFSRLSAPDGFDGSDTAVVLPTCHGNSREREADCDWDLPNRILLQRDRVPLVSNDFDDHSDIQTATFLDTIHDMK